MYGQSCYQCSSRGMVARTLVLVYHKEGELSIEQKVTVFYSWQRGQTKLLVPPVLIFWIAVPQAGHGLPSR